VIAWDDEYGGFLGNSKVLAQAYTSDTAVPAVPTSAGIVEVNTTGLEQFGPGDASVAMRSDGSYVVAYDDFNASNEFDGFVRRIGANGSPLDGSDVQLDTAFPGNTSGDPMPKVAVDSSGNYVVVWESDTANSGGTGIVQKRFWRMGRCSTVPRLSSIPQHRTTSRHRWCRWSMAGPTTGSTWSPGKDQDGSGVYYRQFASITDGAATSGEVQINTTTLAPRMIRRSRSTRPGIWLPGSKMGRPEQPSFGCANSLRRRLSHSRQDQRRLPMRMGPCRSPSTGPGPRTS
jgi:hypothetical protein